MQFKSSSRIVLSLTGQSIRYARIKGAGQSVTVSSHGQLPFDFASFWSEPLMPDNSLTRLLKANGLTKSKVTVGVPAQWCLFDELLLPKLDETSLNSAIGLQAEQRYNRSDRAFTSDYVLPVSHEDKWSVTLGAMAAAHVAALQFALGEAHLKMQAMLPTSLLFHDLYHTDTSKRWQYTAWVRHDQIELFCWNQKRFAGMNLLQAAANPVNGDLHQSIYDTVRQQILQDELIHAVDTQNQNVQLFWDLDQACDVHWFDKPTDARRWQIHPAQVSAQGKSIGNDLMALSALATHDKTPPINLIAPRLTREMKQTTHPWRTRLIMIAALIVLLIGYVSWDLYSLNQQITDLNEQITSMKDGTERAQSIIKLVDRADHWFSTTPQYLACQLSISQAFGSTENVWATNLSLRPDMLGLMNGSAVSESHVLKLIDRMKAQMDLHDVKLLYMRDAAVKNSTEIAYAVSFVYQPVKAAGVKNEHQ